MRIFGDKERVFVGNETKNRELGLLRSEWVIIGCFLLVMSTLVLVAKLQIMRESALILENPLPSHELCKIEIRGAVAKPGVYKVAPGVELKKVLRKSAPLPAADLRSINWDQRVERAMTIDIEKLKEIKVTIQAINSDSIHLVVPVGSRVCDLKSYAPAQGANKKQIFKSRRVLKDGEIIVVDSV